MSDPAPDDPAPDDPAPDDPAPDDPAPDDPGLGDPGLGDRLWATRVWATRLWVTRLGDPARTRQRSEAERALAGATVAPSTNPSNPVCPVLTRDRVSRIRASRR